MAYYDALVAAWNSTTQPPANVTGTGLSSSMTTAQKLAALNGWAVAGPNVNVNVSAVVGYLGLNGKLSALAKYAASPPATAAGVAGQELLAIINCPNAPAFQTSNPTVYQTIEGMLTTLAGDANSGISSTDVTNLLALAATTVPWWQANGYGRPISMDDLTAAGGLS